jgi:hypothetical protein
MNRILLGVPCGILLGAVHVFMTAFGPSSRGDVIDAAASLFPPLRHWHGGANADLGLSQASQIWGR